MANKNRTPKAPRLPSSYNSTTYDHKGRKISETRSKTINNQTVSKTKKYKYRAFSKLENANTLSYGYSIFKIVILLMLAILIFKILLNNEFSNFNFKTIFDYMVNFPQIDLSFLTNWEKIIIEVNPADNMLMNFLQLLGSVLWNPIIRIIQSLIFIFSLTFNAISFISSITTFIFAI